MSLTNWDGTTERRTMNQSDHDLLTRIDANLNNHMESMNKHIVDDVEHFKKVDDDLGWMRKIMYGGIGIYVFIQFIHVIK